MSNSIAFEYTPMWRHYRNHVGEPASDVIVQSYTADYVAMKRTDQGSLAPFLTRNMSVRRLDDDDPLVVRHPNVFPHGGYVVFETDDNIKTRRKKWLFLVTPSEHITEGDQQRRIVHYSADHFSFVVNDGAKPDQRLQLHRTRYISALPEAGEVYPQESSNGFAIRTHNHLPLSFELSPTRPLFISNPNFASLGPVLTDAMSRPWIHASSSQTVHPTARGGGGSARARRRRRIRDADPSSFEDAWRRLPIHRMTVFILGRSITVFLEDRLRHSASHAPVALCFGIEHRDSVPQVEAEIARRLSHMQWEDFEEIAFPGGKDYSGHN